MQRRRRDFLFFVALSICLITLTHSATVRRGGRRRRFPVTIPVGVILDLDSSLGSMALNCTNMALQDFYSTNNNYSTKLQLHFRHSGQDLLTAASAAWDLMNNEKVNAILGPQTTEQARFVVELGNEYNLPVIWFSPSGPSLLPPRSRFFIHSESTGSHCYQFEAIAAIIKAYNWQSVIPIYEDPEFGNDLIPCLTYALQDMDTRVPYRSAIRQNFTNAQITNELNKITGKRTYVFLVHMTVELWSRLVEHVKKAGLMSKRYAWILTQGLSSVMNAEANDIKVKGYMDGALGLRPVIFSNITKRLSLAETLKSEYDKTLSLYGLWVYDTITALANAVEKTGLVVNSTFRYRNGRRHEFADIGPKLQRAIMDTDFQGLSGNFNLRQGQLEPSQVVVYNVKGHGESIIGYWSPETGLVKYHSAVGETAGKYKLRGQISQGNTKDCLSKLKIGVPKTHFTELVNVTVEDENVEATGFAVDVFKKVVDVLRFPLHCCEFVPVPLPVNNNTGELTPSSYDDLLRNITHKDVDVDVIIGDITIVANRAKYVDFTMPYLDSSLSMVIKVRSDSKSQWILLKPFHWILWLILGAIFVGATVVVIILERNKKGDDKSKFKEYAHNPFLIYTSDIQFLRSGMSKWVVIVVTFLLTIAVQVYTANLTSILTERTMAKPSPWKDLQEIKRNNGSLGYQSNSWVKGFLNYQMGFKDHQLKPLGSPKKYIEALSSEDEKEKVDAIFDETPYLMLLLSKCSSCKMTGPIYKTGGFAFAFPKNSSLVSDFSAAIIQVTQTVMTFRDMKKSISLPVTIDKSEYKSDVEIRSLTIDDFGGLFPIVLFVFVFFLSLSIPKIPSITFWLHKRLVSF